MTQHVMKKDAGRTSVRAVQRRRDSARDIGLGSRTEVRATFSPT